MLLPGFACDQAQLPRPLTRHQAAGLFASPPSSPPQLLAPNALGHLFSTCRNLQAMLSAPAALDSDSHSVPPTTLLPLTPPQQQLPTPPLAHAPSPMKLRLRSRKVASSSSSADPASSNPASTSSIARKRIVKRAPPRGLNKRRRPADDDMGRDDNDDDDNDVDSDVAEGDDRTNSPFSGLTSSPFPSSFSSSSLLAPAPSLIPDLLPSAPTRPATATLSAASASAPASPSRPQTPKRARIAPEALPLGLDRSAFHALHADGVPDGSSRAMGTEVEVEADGEMWSTEEDRMLVELVLEKLQLSKTDWQDCARSLGKKDRHSLGRRWKSLMLTGDIGLKPGARNHRRGRIHGTWR